MAVLTYNPSFIRLTNLEALQIPLKCVKTSEANNPLAFSSTEKCHT